MATKKQHDHNFHGLIADTLEMPAVNPAKEPSRYAKKQARPRKNHSVVIAIVAIIVSFSLGFVIRMAANMQSGLTSLTPSIPGLRRTASPQPIELGVDITAELGRKVEVPMQIQQVLPFRVKGNNSRYSVLGGYLLDNNGNADKKRPVMAVFTTQTLEEPVAAGTYAVVGGYVVAINETTQTAASILKPEQETDLAYIAERVNFWDRATILGTHTRPYQSE